MSAEQACWVDGLLLRPTNAGSKKEDGVELYERFGLLRYCTEKTRREFVPAGTRTQFLLV